MEWKQLCGMQSGSLSVITWHLLADRSFLQHIRFSTVNLQHLWRRLRHSQWTLLQTLIIKALLLFYFGLLKIYAFVTVCIQIICRTDINARIKSSLPSAEGRRCWASQSAMAKQRRANARAKWRLCARWSIWLFAAESPRINPGLKTTLESILAKTQKCQFPNSWSPQNTSQKWIRWCSQLACWTACAS